LLVGRSELHFSELTSATIRLWSNCWLADLNEIFWSCLLLEVVVVAVVVNAKASPTDLISETLLM